MFRIRLGRDDHGPASEDEATLVHDLLWAHAVPSDGLEHVRARGVEDGMVLFFFVRAEDDLSGARQACALLTRARRPLAARGLTVPAV
ncbi:hypothetical protein [Streptomyces monomycini]|uniref:hypothetical protein n=1 Tax=Streptomyces monomycini TaxID=371720 RepID=UPI000D129E64|nr:hypothetical protein [Streptomyces monomycini]